MIRKISKKEVDEEEEEAQKEGQRDFSKSIERFLKSGTAQKDCAQSMDRFSTNQRWEEGGDWEQSMEKILENQLEAEEPSASEILQRDHETDSSTTTVHFL